MIPLSNKRMKKDNKLFKSAESFILLNNADLTTNIRS